MDKRHYDEMLENFTKLDNQNLFSNKRIYLFGHCNATEELADLFEQKSYIVDAILDNNKAKQGSYYKNIPIVSPDTIIFNDTNNIIVCIAARAYESMSKQLKQLGFTGRIEKLVDYNSYAEYSLSEETIKKRTERVKQGISLLEKNNEQGYFNVYAPFAALGDVYYMMSYLLYFLKKHNIEKYRIFVIGKACAEVVNMFIDAKVYILSQAEMDKSVQAILYTKDKNSYIAHHDRPYAIYLAKALYIKKIPFETLYKCGVFSLPQNTVPYKPVNLKVCNCEIPYHKSVIISPYAKSVANISDNYWADIINYFKHKNYKVFTNTAGEEKPLNGTSPLCVKLSELQSAVEKAGIFIGLRSGLCDVIKYADCRKIVLYPDCFYSDTKWKMEEIYHLDGWENIIVK